MRLLLFIILFNLPINGYGQFKLNRVYLTPEYGLKRHLGTRITIHAFNHFSTAFSISRTRHKHPQSFTTPKNILFRESHYLYDSELKFNYLVGFTTRNMDILDFSIMAGPSYIQHTIYSNVKVAYTGPVSDGEYNKYFTYDVEEPSTLGLAARIDFAFSMGNHVGFNLGIEGSFNNIKHIYVITAGLSFGLVRDLERLH